MHARRFAFMLAIAASGMLSLAGAAPAAGPPATIVAVPTTTPQSQSTCCNFSPLQALVLDADGNPVSGVTVTFTAPSSGPGLSSWNNQADVETSDAQAIATASVPDTNSTVGSFIVAGSASGVATPAQFSLASSAVNPAADHIHRTSRLSIQLVLDEIHHLAIPSDRWKLHESGAPQPTSAYLRPSAVGFTNNCNEDDYSVHYYYVTVDGPQYASCSVGRPMLYRSHFNEFVPALMRIGNGQIGKSVGAYAMRDTYTVFGNRRRITAEYFCKTASATRAIAKIILTKETASSSNVDRVTYALCK